MPFLNDGYTLDGKVSAYRRWNWPEVKFRYRPALPEQVYDYSRAPKANGKEVLSAITGLLLKQMVSWDLTEEKNGEKVTVPISAEALRAVPHRALEEMVDLVTGYAKDAEAQEADAKN